MGNQIQFDVKLDIPRLPTLTLLYESISITSHK